MDHFSGFTTFDTILLIIAIVAALLGFRSGIVRQLGSLAGIVIGIVGCRIFGPQVEQWLTSVASGQNPAVITILAYALLFLALYFATVAVAFGIRQIVHSACLGIVDRLAGAVFKAALWLFVTSLLLNVWLAFAPSHSPTGRLAHAAVEFAPAVLGSETAQQLWHDLNQATSLPPSDD
ncbi:MAG: CvpA family protein [Bacteroidales bacterium]|nr:CvpA family protein [Bacteroidales bacterium]